MTSEVANHDIDFSGKVENWFRVARDDVSQYADKSISDKTLVIGLSVLRFLETISLTLTDTKITQQIFVQLDGNGFGFFFLFCLSR